MEALTNPHQIIVIGGGPSGLLLAHALQKQGLQVKVFEQDRSLYARPRDWNFGIHDWSHTALKDCLPSELAVQLETVQVDHRIPSPDEIIPILNGETGELLTEVPIPFHLRLAKKRFCALISQGLDIRYGKKLVGVSSDGQTATASFTDGSSEVAKLVIGCDGAHSKVRDILLGTRRAALCPLPIIGTWALARLPRAAAEGFLGIHHRFMIVSHPYGSFSFVGLQDAPVHSEPGDWEFLLMMTWAPQEEKEYETENLQGDTALADLRRRGERYSEPFRTIYTSVPDGTKCWHTRLAYWVPPDTPWDNLNGTLTMVGDAAHPMTAHRGQGYNTAIHDVANLVKQIKEKGLCPEAIREYETEMVVRGREAVLGSNTNTLALHQWDKLKQSPLFTMGVKRDQS